MPELLTNRNCGLKIDGLKVIKFVVLPTNKKYYNHKLTYELKEQYGTLRQYS